MELHKGRLIGHVHPWVSELEAAKRFHLAALGLTEFRERPDWFSAGELWIDRAEGAPSRVHLAFQAPTRDHAGAFREAAFAAGETRRRRARGVVIGGQNAVDREGQVIGKGNMAAQTAKAIENLFEALAAANGRPEHLVKLGIHAVTGHDLAPAFGEWLRLWGGRAEPPAITVLQVSGLSHPDFLVEVEGTAVIPDDRGE